MLRADNVICGTSTTGTGTLTLAACPSPPGGVDFDVWLRATGIGFGNSAAVLVSYTIIEYTDTTFATAKQFEKGLGTLTLGSSSGIANATLARTTLQEKAISLNSQPASFSVMPATGISIGTAANTLIFVGASAIDIRGSMPDYGSSLGADNAGVPPLLNSTQASNGGTMTPTTATDYYSPFVWTVPMLVKRASIVVTTAYSGGSPVSNADARLYAFDPTTGKPGKLLYDFGLLGSSGASLNSTGVVSTGASGNGFLLMPGEYVLDICTVFSGGSAGPAIAAWNTTSTQPGIAATGRWGTRSLNGYFAPLVQATASGGAIGAAPDPANITGFATIVSGLPGPVCFALKGS